MGCLGSGLKQRDRAFRRVGLSPDCAQRRGCLTVRRRVIGRGTRCDYWDTSASQGVIAVASGPRLHR